MAAVAVVVVALLVLAWFYPLVPFARALYSSEAPPVVEEGIPSDAVLRVSAPEGETYRVQWGFGPLTETEEGTIDPDLGYQDHQANPRGVGPSGEFDVTVLAGTEDTYPMGEPGTEVGAVLFVSGEAETCVRGEGTTNLRWKPQGGPPNPLARPFEQLECESYAYSIP